MICTLALLTCLLAYGNGDESTTTEPKAIEVKPLLRTFTPDENRPFDDKKFAKQLAKNKPRLDKKPTGKRLPDKNAGSNIEDEQSMGIESQIVGGVRAKRAQFPWQARILIDGEYMCGGSLIDREWILTAAHCVHGFSSWNITLGIVKLSVTKIDGRIELTSTESFVHEGYKDDTLNNDIALLKLPEAVTLSKFIQIVRLPSTNDATANLVRKRCIISGWGKIGDDDGTSDDLKFLKRQIQDNKECVKLYGSEIISSSSLCIKNNDKQGTCQGDSGGPFVCKEKGKYTQLGLVSFGSSVSCMKYPSGFTRVSSFLGWISEITGLKIAAKY